MTKFLLKSLAVVLNALPKTDKVFLHWCELYGRYGLEAPNLIGMASAPTVTTDSTPSSITQTAATFDTNSITNTGGENATTRGICWVSGAGGTPTTANTVSSTSGSYTTGDFSASMSGLSAGTTYSVRAFATNSAGTGYGSTVEVTTLSNQPPTVSFVVDSYSETNGDVFSTIFGTAAYSSVGQSFTGNGEVITKAKFYLRKAGSPTGNVVAKVYAHSGTFGSSSVPTGAALATSDNFDISTLTTNFALTDFSFSGVNQITLTNTTKYVVVVEYTGGSVGNTLQVSVDESSPSHSGNGVGYATGSSSWVSFPEDFCFYVISEPVLETSDTTPTLEFTGTDPDSDDIRYNIQVGSLIGYEIENQNTTRAVTGTNSRVSQSFTAPNNIPLQTASFYLSKSSTPTGTATAVLYAHSGTLGTSSVPTGSALATSASFDISTLTTSLALVTFTFTGGYSLTGGTNYVIALETTGISGLGNQVNVGEDNTSPTHAGNAASYNTGTWTAQSGEDLCFYVNTTNAVSGTDSGFADVTTPADTDPFESGDKVSYTVQSALAEGTYYWRVRGIDPSGSNTYGAWSSTRSFTIESSGTSYTQTLNETITYTDAFLKQGGKQLSETITLSDTLTRLGTFLRTLTDTVTFTDTVVKQTGKPLVETITYTDVLTAIKIAFVTLTETITYTSTLTRQTAKNLIETITSTDTLARTTNKVLTETATFTDSLIKQTGKTLTEVITYTDVLTTLRTAYLTLTETITYTDSLVRQTLKNLIETITFTDTVAKTTAKTFSETVTLADTIDKQAQKQLTETITFSDVLETVRTYIRVLTETITYTDTITKSIDKVFTETITFTDSVVKQISKTLTDTLTYTDTLVKQTYKVLTETITWSDVLDTLFTAGGTLYTLTLEEIVTFTDTVNKATSKVYNETLTYTDSVLKTIGKVFTETITLSDTLTKGTGKFLSETITISDTTPTATSGINSPATAVDDNSVGSITWSNPGNILTSDNSYASVTVDAGDTTHYLKATNFGFSIPLDATISGIKVEWEKKKVGGGGGGAKDAAIRIVKGGVIGTTDKSSASEWATSDTYSSYGGSSDLWGETWTPADINDSTFGAALQGRETDGNIWTLQIDHVRITVYYTSEQTLLTKRTTKNLTETLTFTDALTRALGKVMNETIAYTDSLAKSLYRTLSEVITLTDSMTRSVYKVMTETLSYTDTLIKSTAKTLQETLTLTDTIVKSISKTLTEEITWTDVLNNVFIPIVVTIKKYYSGGIAAAKRMKRGIGF